MRKKKLLVWFLVVLMLMTSIAVLVGCKKPKDPPEVPTVGSVSAAISEAIKATYGYNKGEDLSWDFALDFAVSEDNYSIATKGNVSRATATSNKFVLDVVKNDKNIFKASADDDFLYFDFGEEKYRYVNFDFAEMMASDNAGNSELLDTLAPVLKAALSSMFETGTIDGNKHTLSGSLPNFLTKIVELISEGLKTEIPLVNDVISLIPSDTMINFSVIIDGGICKGMNLDLASSDSNFVFNMSKTNLSKTLLEISTPAKDDANYIECQMFNYTINGTFDMFKNVDRANQEKTTFTWELRVDINPFDLLRNGLFSDKNDSLIYFNVSHVCDGNCASFCDTKMNKSKGSIIDIVYDNKNFNNKINVALNTKYLIPQELMNEINALAGGTLDVAALLPEYLATNINPEVFGYLFQSDASQVGYVENNFNLGFNPVNLVRQILGLVSSIELNDNTFGFSVDQLIDMISSFDNMGITRILDMFLKDIGNVRVNIDNVIHGDKSNETYKSYEKFIMISENTVLKSFTSPGNNFNVSKEILGFEKDKNGNVMFAYNPDGNIYKADGTPLPASKEEVKKMLSSAVTMNYLDTNGILRQTSVPIVKVEGVDYDKVGEQKVKLILGLTDGNSLGYLLQLLSSFQSLLGFEIPVIPGDVIETTINITPTKDVSFSQAEDALHKFDPDKLYKFNDNINIKFDVKVVYDYKNEDGSDYEKTTKGIIPAHAGAYVYNYGGENPQLQAFDTFDLKYEAFGIEETITVKMVDSSKTKAYLGNNNSYSETTNVSINTWTSSYNRVHVNYVDGKDESGADKFSLFKGYLRANNKVATYIEPQANMECSISDAGLISLKFTKAGTYTVKGKFLGANIEMKYVVLYNAESVPSYIADGTVVTKDTLAVNFNRPNQHGDGVRVALDVRVLKGEEMVTLTAEQYKLYAKDYNGNSIELDKIIALGKLLPGGYTVYVEIIDPEYAFATRADVYALINVRAVDYDDAVIIRDIEYIGRYENINFDLANTAEKLNHDNEQEHYTVKVTESKIDGELYKGIELGLIISIDTSDNTAEDKNKVTTKTLAANEYDIVVVNPPFVTGWPYSVETKDLAFAFSSGANNRDVRIMFNNSLFNKTTKIFKGFKVKFIDKADNNRILGEFAGTVKE